MAKNNNIGKDLADLLATHNFDVEMSSTNNQSATADEATVFKFDYVTPRGRNYGTAVIVISNDNELILFYGDNLGRGMEQEDKDDWFAFMKELKDFSIRHNFHNFSPKNLNQLKHTMQGMAAIKEGLFEGYYGNRRVSYMGEATDARLVIKHDRMIGENDKRYRYVESLFIETVDGERFRLPFKNLSGGRAMLEHVRQGGRPYDIRGQHITDTVNEMSVLSRFRRAQQGRVFEAATQRLVEQANAYYESLHTGLKRMATSRGYSAYFENWTPADIGPEESLVENLRSMFVQQTLDSRIEAALPTLAKLQGTTMKEADIFESWATRVSEGTWALPDNAEAQEKLNQLMNSELIVGPDAINATELLYDIVGDDRLYDILKDLADRNPRANIWDDSDVRNRMEELGIQLPMQSNGAEGEAGADTDNMGISADDQLSEGDNLATFEGSCNHTMEGEYCPEHGLMECGMHEDAHDPVHEARVANPRVNEIRTLAKWFFGGNPYSSATISGGRQLRLSFHIGHRLDGDYRYVPPSAISPADRRRLDRLKAKFMEYMAQKGVDQTEVSIQFHIGSGVYAGVRIAIPQEDGTIPTNLPTSTGPYKQYKGLAESAANISESVYHPNKPYGVQYIVFAGKEQRAVTKEAWFATAEAMERGVERIENLPNFYEIRGYHYPEATAKSGVTEDASAMPTEKVGSIIRRVLGNRLTWTPGTSKLYKNTRKNKARTQRVDDYAMKYVDVQGVGSGGTSYDRAEEGGKLAKALKTELVRAGYQVSQGPIIFSDQIMFQTRSPITVTTEGDHKSVSFRDMVNVVDRYDSKYYAALSASDISDEEFEKAIVDTYNEIVRTKGLDTVLKYISSGYPDLNEGDDRGNYRATAQAAEAATRTAKTPQEHARAADLHDRAATYALSDGRDESVIYDHQMTARAHRRAAKGVAEGSKIARANKLGKAPKPKNQQEYDAIEKYRKDLAQSYKPNKEQGVAEGKTANPPSFLSYVLANTQGKFGNVEEIEDLFDYAYLRDLGLYTIADGAYEEGVSALKWMKPRMSWLLKNMNDPSYLPVIEPLAAAWMKTVAPAIDKYVKNVLNETGQGVNDTVAEGYSLKKTSVSKYMQPGDPDEYTQDISVKDTDYEIINNKTGQVVGTASWTTNDFFGPGAIKITMKNGATRYLDIWASEKGNPQSAFNRFVKDPNTAKKYKDQGVAEGRATYGPITDAHKAAAKKAFAAGERDGKAGAEKNKEYMSSALLKTPYLNGYKQGKQGVSEGLGKSIKRGMAGWGAFDKDKPADVVNRVKGQDTDTLKTLSNRGSTGKGSPAELQQKAIGRELKKRGEQGVAEAGNNPVDHEWYRKQQERKAKAAKRQDRQQTQSKVAEGSLNEGYIVKNGSKYLKGHPAGGGQMTWVTDKAKATVFKSKGEITRAANMRGWSVIPAPQGVAEGQLNEYLTQEGQPLTAILELNLFMDMGPDGVDFMDTVLVKKYKPIADQLAKLIQARKKRKLTADESAMIDDVWYDGSDAYDDMEVEFLADLYNQQIEVVKDILENQQGVSEASPDTTLNALKGLKSWQVVIMNNYYRGKYSDYSGRYYYVLATSPEEAKQVVLDNADAILQELLAMKSVNGRKILPRSSAVPVTADRIGQVRDGTEAGRMSTAGFKKMFSPQGPMMVKLSDGAVVDVKGQEQGVAEGQLDEISAKLAQAVADKRGSNAATYRAGLAATGVDQDAITKYPPWRKMSYKALKSQQAATQRLNKERGVEEATDQTVAESILRLQQLAQIRR